MQSKNNSHKDSQIKARKRQFDSRWRANIAGCFETLLQIIPMNKRAIKKQSKAQILESTILHLDFLEKTFVLLLMEKAAGLEVTSKLSWCFERFQDMEESFIKKELSKPRKAVQSSNKIKKLQAPSNDVCPILKTNNNLLRLKERSIDPIKIEHSLSQDLKKFHSFPHAEDKPNIIPTQNIPIANTSGELLCDEQLTVSDDEGVCCSPGVECTPCSSTADIPGQNQLKPLKRKLKTFAPWPSKCRRSILREDEFMKTDLMPEDNDNGEVQGCESSDDDKRMGEMDPWWMGDGLQRGAFLAKHPPSNDGILPLRDELWEGDGTYAGRHSPLFGLHGIDDIDFKPVASVFDHSDWASSSIQ